MAAPAHTLSGSSFGLHEVDTGSSKENTAFPSTREDHRVERRERGVVRWGLQRSTSDVVGFGVRSKTGHVLKNQSFYSTQRKENLWSNPTHAGPKTWKEWHGPRLHTDAPLMEHMDRLSAQQADWEAKKAFVNTVRMQTLDRFYNQKLENEQKEKASQWAPHRRTKREVHNSLNSFAAELDSMPVKELKKVLHPKVLHNDREAIKSIAKKVQDEEAGKAEWKRMEEMRREDLRFCHEQRVAYNEMMMELAAQPNFRRNVSERQLPNSCTNRLEEMARPVPLRIPKDPAKHPDFRGLFHVDNKHALETLFPGTGHELANTLTEKAAAGVESCWTQLPPPTTPNIESKASRVATSENLENRELMRTGSVPVSKTRLTNVTVRHDDALLMKHASVQFQRTIAPPAPEQRKTLLKEPLAPDVVHMNQSFSPREEHTSKASRGLRRMQTQENVAPPQRSMVYPVVVPTVEAEMEQPNWRPKRQSSSAAISTIQRQAPQHGNSMSHTSKAITAGANVNVMIIAAGNLPKADRSAHSNAYVTCHIPGKAKSTAKTKVVQDTATPVWNQALAITGWKKGDPLMFTIYDHGIIGNDDKLATLQLPSKQFYPQSFKGKLLLENTWLQQGQRISDDLKKQNMALKPTLEVKITVQDPDDSESEGDEDLLIPGKELTLQASPSTWKI